MARVHFVHVERVPVDFDAGGIAVVLKSADTNPPGRIVTREPVVEELVVLHGVRIEEVGDGSA